MIAPDLTGVPSPDRPRVAIRRELGRADRAVYRAVADFSTPVLDLPLRKISDFANHSKPWFIVAAGLAVLGGTPERVAALTGVARHRTHLTRGEPAHEARSAPRATGPPAARGARVPLGADADIDVVPFGTRRFGCRLRRRRRSPAPRDTLAPANARSRPGRGRRPPAGSTRAGRGRAGSAAAGSRAASTTAGIGSVTTYWCDIGTIGTRTPASRAISAAYMPPQSTTTSHSTSPRSVRTLVTRRAVPAVDGVDRQHAGAGGDPDAARAGAGRQRVGELRRVDLAVRRQEAAAGDAAECRRAGTARRPRPARSPPAAGRTCAPSATCRRISSSRSGARGDLDAAALDPARRVLAGLEPPVQLDAVHVHPGQGGVGAQLADETGGVEGRARRQLGALDQQDVALAELGEVVGDGGAADPAADDDDPGAGTAGRLGSRGDHAGL